MAANPKDPENYRGGFFDQIDVPALISMVISAVGFLLLVLLVKPKIEETLPADQKMDDLSERMARILMPLRPTGSHAKENPLPRAAPKPKSTTPDKNQNTLSRIERSRQRLAEHLQEVGARVSRTAVLSILSSKNPHGRGGGSSVPENSLGFGDLNQRLSALDGLTRYDDRATVGNGKPAPRDLDPGKADADPLLQKFATARKTSATKIGSLAFERPQLLGGNAKQAGGKQLQALSAFIGRNQTSVRLIYEEHLKTNPTLEGKLTLVLIIEEDGHVSSARAIASETTLSDPDFQTEIIRMVLRWVFPPFHGGPVELKSPFVFKPL